MTANDRAVVVMAKRPRPGATKTRMMPALSAQRAADLYEALLLDTIDMLVARDDCTTLIAVDEPESADYFSVVAPGLGHVLQGPGALGDRLDRVLTDVGQRGFSEVFAINSDGPDLPSSHLDAAFTALGDEQTDLVFGPNVDGGYYLIGWKKPWPSVVTDVTMSTPTVLADTLEIAESLDAVVALAPEWFDVDVADDLPRLAESLAGMTTRTAVFLAEVGSS